MKSLVIYFSRADENYAVGYVEKGNTEVIAEYIRDIIGANLFKVERETPYPKEYVSCIEEAQRELNEDARPELLNILDNIDDYDVIYIGQPIWWGYPPMPMFTQLEKLNWSGKIVKPFTTHEGSGLGSVIPALTKLCPGAEIKEGLAIQGSQVTLSKDKVEEWINR